MQILMGVALVVVLALLASSKRFWRLRRTRVGAVLTTGGWLMLAVGLLLGPHGMALVKLDEWAVIDPLVLICLGWVGVMVGLGADRKLPSMIPAVVKKVVLWDVSASVLIIGAAALWAIAQNTSGAGAGGSGGAAGISGVDAVLPLAILLGVCSVSWSAEGRSLTSTGSDAEGRVIQVLRAGSGIGGMLALAVYVFALGGFVVQGDQLINSPLALSLELIVSMLMAVVLGWLGLFLMGLAGRGNGELLVVLLGLVTLVAGAAATMGDSPLFVSLLVGAVLVNGPQKEKGLTRLKRVILEGEQPVAKILMLAAGLLLDPRVCWQKAPLAWTLIAAILIARFVVKLIGARWILRRGMADTATNNTVLFGLMRQNPLAIAIACGYAISPLATYPAAPLTGGEVLMILMMVGLISELSPFIGRACSKPPNLKCDLNYGLQGGDA